MNTQRNEDASKRRERLAPIRHSSLYPDIMLCYSCCVYCSCSLTHLDWSCLSLDVREDFMSSVSRLGMEFHKKNYFHLFQDYIHLVRMAFSTCHDSTVDVAWLSFSYDSDPAVWLISDGYSEYPPPEDAVTVCSGALIGQIVVGFSQHVWIFS